MKIKAIYRKNLKMSEQKVASQVSHAVMGLKHNDPLIAIVVLKVSDKKFFEEIQNHKCFVQKDFGYTEVDEGTITAAAWFEKENHTDRV